MTKTKTHALAAMLILCSATAGFANTLLTFQVDMTQAIAGAVFDPLTQTLSTHGSFNGWGAGLPLTNNPAGANPALYSGTINVPTNGIVVAYKYVIDPGGIYEAVRSGGGHNRLITLPSASGSSFTAPLVYYGDAPPADITTSVIFQVNMAQQINIGAFIPNTSTGYTRGQFNNYGLVTPMTNDPSIRTTNQFGLVNSNVYVAAFDVAGSPGETVDYKYFIDTGSNWESPAPGVGDPADNNNRFFNLPTSTQSLPIIYFNDAPFAPKATNAVTFQVDMTAQVQNGSFDPVLGTVEVRGNFNGWGTPQILCTNDLSAANTNIFKTVVSIVDGIGAFEFYKFWSSISVNGGWETMADNRSMRVVSGTAQTLPVVFFSNLDPSDFLTADTLVTFRVSMTNAVGTDSHIFDPASDAVYINGVPSFVTWSTALPQCTNNPVGSKIYSIDMLLPKGSTVQQTYKYGMDGLDDEAAPGANHVRYVRSTGAYVMPLDIFGNQIVELSFGNLQASSSTAGHVLISWLGRPGVHLQTKASLSSGSWVDHPETDGLSSTNWPSSAGPLFFRLIKP